MMVVVVCTEAGGAGWDFKKDVQVHGMADFRFFHSDAAAGIFNEGLGKSRTGENLSTPETDNTLQLAEASVVVTSQFGWSWSGNLHLKYDPEQEKTPVDVTEGFLRYKSFPRSGFLFKSRLGAFFPPVSLENTGPAWTSPFSITPSAINTWIGEEVKTIGGEFAVEKRVDDVLVEALGAVFMGNDPAGTLLAWRGWALHDRKTGIFDRMPLPPLYSFNDGQAFSRQAQWLEPFQEIDDRPGFYGGLNISLPDLGQLNLLYYDNRADGSAFDGSQYAWETDFINVGARIFLPFDMTFMTQYMKGSTQMGKGPGVHARFWSFYTLLSKQIDRHRVTLRYDRFTARDLDATAYDDNNESGWAWIFAYGYDISSRHLVKAEWLSIRSDRPERERLGWDGDIHETVFQISYQFFFGLPG